MFFVTIIIDLYINILYLEKTLFTIKLCPLLIGNSWISFGAYQSKCFYSFLSDENVIIGLSAILFTISSNISDDDVKEYFEKLLNSPVQPCEYSYGKPLEDPLVNAEVIAMKN